VTIGIIALLFFVAMVLAFVAFYMGYAALKASPRHQLKKRMRGLVTETAGKKFPVELKLEILKDMGVLDRTLFSFKPIRKLDVLIDSAGLKVDVKIFALIIFGVSALAYFVGAAFGFGRLFSLIFTPVGFFIPVLYLFHKRRRMLEKFTLQFPDAIEMVSRSLKAGHSFSAAMEMIESEMPDPVGGLFKTAYEEQSLGLSTREALDHMILRMPSNDLRFFVMALNIHREIGGNLGEILERLSRTIRDRIRIRRQVRVYSAQARLSGYILAAAPIVMSVLLYVALRAKQHLVRTVGRTRGRDVAQRRSVVPAGLGEAETAGGPRLVLFDVDA